MKRDPTPGKTPVGGGKAVGLRDTYLPTTGFDHEFSGQVGRWLRLQGTDDNALVQRITGYNLKGRVVSSDGPGRPPRASGLEAGPLSRMLAIPLGAWRGTGQRGWLCRGGDQPALFPYLPMVEDRQGKGLPLRVSPQIGLKAKRVDGGDESFDGVERGAWDGCILSHVPPETEKQRLSP